MSARTQFVCALLFAGAGAVSTAQTAVNVLEAELAAGFGATAGRVVLVDDELVFVDATDAGASFALSRSNVAGVERKQDVVTVSLHRAVRNQREVMFRLTRATDIVEWFNLGSAEAAAPQVDESDALATYEVRHDHLIGGCVGRLMILEDRLAFESLDERNDSRQWAFSDISEISQDGIYKLKVRPFLGNEYNLELVGRGMSSQQFRDLSSRVADARVR